LGDRPSFMGGSLDLDLSVDHEDPLQSGRHEEATSLLSWCPLDRDLGDVVEDGLVDLLSVTGGVLKLLQRMVRHEDSLLL
jgi:hypothetical protein